MQSRMDRAGLGDFLRRRREALPPSAAAVPALTRRRTPGLRREEVAELAGMSANYYERLERASGPQPSGAVLAGLARALRLTDDETAHLHVLAGHGLPAPAATGAGVDDGLRTALDSLSPATIGMICDDQGEVLAENAASVAVLGRFTGGPGNIVRRWFTDRAWRDATVPRTHQEQTSRAYVADLRATRADSGALVRELRAASAEFDALWSRHEVSALRSGAKVLLHPRGRVDLRCAVLPGRSPGQRLVLFHPAPGTGTAALLGRASDR